MKKHTPGPWVWGSWTIHDEDREAQNRREPYWTLEVGMKDVLTQGPIGRKSMDTDFVAQATGYEAEGIGASPADMALIAAAPEMLEALKGARTALVSTFGRNDTPPWVAGYMRAVDEAIAKAEGSTK